MKIETKNLTKTYKGSITGIEDVTITIENSMFGLLRSTISRYINKMYEQKILVRKIYIVPAKRSVI